MLLCVALLMRHQVRQLGGRLVAESLSHFVDMDFHVERLVVDIAVILNYRHLLFLHVYVFLAVGRVRSLHQALLNRAFAPSHALVPTSYLL